MEQMPNHKYNLIAFRSRLQLQIHPLTDGTNNTRCKRTTPTINAIQLYLFEKTPILKIDCLERELKPCNNLDKHNVANAIVLAAHLISS